MTGTLADTLIVVGLGLEIMGATALAGPFVGREFKEIYDFGARYYRLDLKMEYKDRENLVWMVGLFGLFLLISGFILQMTGFLVQIGLTRWTGVLVVSVGLGEMGLLWLLTRLDPKQSVREKISVYFGNIKRLAIRQNGLRCDKCRKELDLEGAEVWWCDDSYAPSSFHIGHPSCLQTMQCYQDPSVRQQLEKQPPIHFLASVVPGMRNERIQRTHARYRHQFNKINDTIEAELADS